MCWIDRYIYRLIDRSVGWLVDTVLLREKVFSNILENLKIFKNVFLVDESQVCRPCFTVPCE